MPPRHLYVLSSVISWAVGVLRPTNLLRQSTAPSSPRSYSRARNSAEANSLLEKDNCCSGRPSRSEPSTKNSTTNSNSTSPGDQGGEGGAANNKTAGRAGPEAAKKKVPAGEMGAKLRSRSFEFPNYSDAQYSHQVPKGNNVKLETPDGGLIGKIFIHEMKMDGVGTRYTAAYYLARGGDGVSGDAQCDTGSCAAELDLVEANHCGFTVTPHICQLDQPAGVDVDAFQRKTGRPTYERGTKGVATPGVTVNGGPCDGRGCDTHPAWLKAKDWFEAGADKPASDDEDLWGPGQYIDSTQWHEVAYYFVKDQESGSGDLAALWVRLKQGKKAAAFPTCDRDTLSLVGEPGEYLKMFGNHLKAGKQWLLQHSKWGGPRLDWLTAAYPGADHPGNVDSKRCDPSVSKHNRPGLNNHEEIFRNYRLFDPDAEKKA